MSKECIRYHPWRKLKADGWGGVGGKVLGCKSFFSIAFFWCLSSLRCLLNPLSEALPSMCLSSYKETVEAVLGAVELHLVELPAASLWLDRGRFLQNTFWCDQVFL